MFILVPFLFRSCSVLVPFLFRSCSVLVPFLFRSLNSLAKQLTSLTQMIEETFFASVINFGKVT
jgi:hypothetical protein